MHIAPEKSTLPELTRQFLATAQFDKQSQDQFSTQFHYCYHSASLADRILVSELCCRASGIPLDVLMLLCCDDDKVASPILSHSPILGKSDLTTQILQGSESERAAIARRQDLNSVLVSNLLSFGERPVARALLENVDHLPTLSANLHGRMKRLGGADLESTGQQGMTKEKDTLDDLVSSMEREWHAHYRPESLERDKTLSASTGARQTRPNSPERPEDPVIEPPTDPVGFIEETDLSLLAKLEEADWEHLDDEAIEALASSLAEEDIARLEADSLGQPVDQRVSFRIEALDKENAPIPPLEVKRGDTRDIQIAFQGKLGDEDETAPVLKSQEPEVTKTLETSLFADFSFSEFDAVINPPSSVDKQTVDTDNKQAMARSAQDHEARQAARQQPQTLPQLSEPSMASGASVDPTSPESQSGKTNVAEEGEERRPQITLTIRKKNSQTENGGNTTEEAPDAHKVALNSATEEDWLTALAHLNSDYTPSSSGHLAKTEAVAARAPDKQPGNADQLASKPERSATSQSRNSAALPAKTDDDKAQAQASVKESPSAAPQPEASRPEPIAQESIDPEPIAQKPVANEPLIHEHAPMGFMPDMISFGDLGLVEAEPDLPSATELLLQQQQRSAPLTELVEPVELSIREDGKEYSLDDIAAAPMQVVADQLAAQRDTKQETAFEPSAISPETPTDMTELPAFSEHRLVEMDEFETLRASDAEADRTETGETERQPITPPLRSVTLTEIAGTSGQGSGMAEAFYGYDDEARLTLLQGIMAETLVEARQINQDIVQRSLLSEEAAQELVMARFSNNRIHLADLMHDISGHRRLDMTSLLQDSGGEALVVYLYHIGLDESRTLSMVLHGPDAVSHSYSKVSQLMTLYNQLYPAAAGKIVEELFGLVRQTKPVYQPIHDDGSGRAAPRMRDGARPTERNSEESKIRAFGRRVAAPES